MIDCTADVLVGVLKGGSEAVKAMPLDIDIDDLVLIAAGNSRDKGRVIAWVSPSVESVSAIASVSYS